MEPSGTPRAHDQHDERPHADITSNLAEGENPVTITKYGQYSLKSVLTQPLRPSEDVLSSRAAFLILFCFGVDE
jgi:hypothetical protein